MTRFLTLCFLLSVASLFSSGQPPVRGSLVIVGGGLEPDNKSIFSELIRLAGGAKEASFAVIPSAGGAPMQSFVYFKSELISYGVKPGNIHLIPIAVIDDDSTGVVNESEWKDNGNDHALAKIVKKCSAVWFTGGDQLRTTRTLFKPDGSQTVVLEAVWDVYRSGGVIGGTSAGAAIMSEVMIGAGTSIAALEYGVKKSFTGEDFPEDSGVLVTRGLGFFPHGIVDQHFNQRARIGRLAVTLMNQPGPSGDRDEDKAKRTGEKIQSRPAIAFGIDENTALIYDAKDDRMKVAGAGGVTILNSKGARLTLDSTRSIIENLGINYLEEGDSFDFSTGTVVPAGGKLSTRGREHYQEPYSGQSGIFSPNPPSFRDLYTEYLADNKSAGFVECLSVTGKDSGLLVTWRKTPETVCFRPEKNGHRASVTVTNFRMNITPVRITATPINNKY